MGSFLGSRKTAAKKIGLTLEEYDQKISDGMKWCTDCKSWKLVSDFYKDATRGDGISAKCISCLIKNSAYPGVHERKIKRSFGLAWCRFCKDWLFISDVTGGMCKHHRNELARNSYKNNPKVRAERTQHSHSRKRNIDPIPVLGQEIILEDFDGKCAYCGAPADTWDHIIPVAKGGNTSPGNIVPACSACNSSKKDSDLLEWMNRKGYTPSQILIDRISFAEAGFYG